MVPKLVHAWQAKMMLGSVNKTDRLDGRGMNRLQLSGTLPAVWIPPKDLRDKRELFCIRMVFTHQRPGVQFSISVPFECFAELKQLIESRRLWKRLDSLWDFFESDWAPKCWERRDRFLFLRHRGEEAEQGTV